MEGSTTKSATKDSSEGIEINAGGMQLKEFNTFANKAFAEKPKTSPAVLSSAQLESQSKELDGMGQCQSM